MIAYCKHKGIGILAYSPLMDGHLARPVDTETPRTKSINGTPLEKRRRDSDKEIIRRVEELAAKRGWTMSQVALAWVASKATTPISGANTVSRLGLLWSQSTEIAVAGTSSRFHCGWQVAHAGGNTVPRGTVSHMHA